MSPIDEFRAGAHTRQRGSSAEADGCAWLSRQGYRIVARNVRFSFGEIDVVARDGETICFVEIKARASRRHGGAVFAVSPAKQRQLARLARIYLARHPHPGPCRFDVLAMDGGRGGWTYTLFRHAFEVA